MADSNFGGINFSDYPNWRQVKGQSGQVYYVVPGNEGYVYDPFLSGLRGKTQLFMNPEKNNQAIAEQEAEVQRQKDLQQQQIDLQKQQASPMGQLLPVGASIGGLYAANQLMGGGAALSGAGSAGIAGGAGSALTSAGAGASDAFTASALGGGGSGVGTGTGAVAAEAPSSFGLLSGNVAGTGLGVAPLAAIAGATYLGGKSAYDLINGKEDKSVPGLIGRASLGIATGGLSELARYAGLGSPSTRDIAKKHTSELLNQGQDNQAWQSFVSGMREQYNSAPVDPSKPFAGKYKSWDEYKTAGLEAGDLTGVYGNLKTYGPEWAGLTQEQRVAVTQANINDGLYDSKKGEVNITDPDKARKNFERVISGQQPVMAPIPVPAQKVLK